MAITSPTTPSACIIRSVCSMLSSARNLAVNWFETGTPTYLVELLKRHHYNLERMAHEETNAQVLNSIDSESTSPIPVIYQSGYLTIKGYDEEFGIISFGLSKQRSGRRVHTVSCTLLYQHEQR